MERQGLVPLYCGATTSRAHMAIKIAPHYTQLHRVGDALLVVGEISTQEA